MPIGTPTTSAPKNPMSVLRNVSQKLTKTHPGSIPSASLPNVKSPIRWSTLSGVGRRLNSVRVNPEASCQAPIRATAPSNEYAVAFHRMLPARRRVGMRTEVVLSPSGISVTGGAVDITLLHT